MKKKMMLIGGGLAIIAVLIGGIFAYQQQQAHKKSHEEQQREELAAKQASEQAVKELEKSQRAQIITMPSDATKPKDNIARGWSAHNAALFVSQVADANKHREKFPRLDINTNVDLEAVQSLKPYMTAPYWVVALTSEQDKDRAVFLKNNGNHTVTMVLTEGETDVPVHEYVVDSSTHQFISEKSIDVASSISTWTEF